MIRKEYAMFETIDRSDKKGVLFDSVLSGWGIEPRVGKNLYARFAYKPEEIKTYMFTDNTMQRLLTMDFSELKAPEILQAAQMSVTEKGFVLTSGTYQKLHFCYLIFPGQIIISVMQGKIKTFMSDHEIANTVVGNIIISPEGIHLSPTNTLTPILRMNEYRDLSVETWTKYVMDMSSDIRLEVFRLTKHITNLSGAPDKPITDTLQLLNLREDPRFCNDEKIKIKIRDFDYRSGLLNVALKMFLFLKCADISKLEIVNEDTLPKLSYLRGVKRMNYTVVDSTWDKEIDVNNPFIVRGHFRLQPVKEGTRLIYIDTYWKKGYHRRSAQEINESLKTDHE